MAENIIATWRVPGLQKADPQKVYEELRTICDEVTEAKPQDIVNLAKDKSLEIHKCFEWNDTKAAEKWRLHQAVKLTSDLIFKREQTDDGDEPLPVRIFNKTDNGGYKIPERVFKVDDEYQKLLQRAMAELHMFKVKYAVLSELDEILALIP